MNESFHEVITDECMQRERDLTVGPESSGEESGSASRHIIPAVVRQLTEQHQPTWAGRRSISPGSRTREIDKSPSLRENLA